MIGVVLVGHGDVAQAMLNVLTHVVGPQAQMQAIGMQAEDDMDSKRADILAAIDAVNTGQGVVVLTDMFGGTPSNLAISMLDQKPIDVLAGFNVPMLVKIASLRQQTGMTRQQLLEQGKEAGRKYINVASELLAAQ